MSFPNSSIGLPNTVDYKLAPSLAESARCYSVNVSPDGVTQVTGPNQSLTYAAVTAVQNQFNSQVISFTLPSGMSDSVFMDPVCTTVSFSLIYTVTTAPSVTSNSTYLLGSAASFIDQLQVYSNNVPIESINQYGLLQNFLLQNTVSNSERVGGLSVSMGCDTNSLQGFDIPTAVGTYRFNFCIPLISILGVNSDKFIPIGSISNMQLQLTTANLCPIVAYCATVTTQPAFSLPFTLVDWTLNMKYIDIGDMSAALLKQTLVDSKWFIKAATYTQSAVTIPSGSQGAQQLLLQIRNTSVKSLFHQFGIANGSAAQSIVAPNGYFDALNICTNSRQLQIGGNFYPNKAISDTQQPAVGYTYTIQSLGGGLAKSYGTAVTRSLYNSVGGVGAIPTGSDTTLQIPTLVSNIPTRPNYTGNDEAAQSCLKFSASAYYGYDLEKSANTMFSGVNTRAQPPFIALNLGAVTNASITCNAWGLSDVILAVDVNSKSVQAFI
jgi:hypothetical protein